MAVFIATWRSYSHERSSGHTKAPEYMTNRSRSIFKGHGLDSCDLVVDLRLSLVWDGVDPRNTPIGYHTRGQPYTLATLVWIFSLIGPFVWAFEEAP